jgi:hypothetical protein
MLKYIVFLLINFFVVIRSESECKLTGTYIDSAHVGVGTLATVQIVGSTFNFTGFSDTFMNNVSTVVVSTTTNEWLEIVYNNNKCGLAKVDGATIELTTPLSACATKWPTTDPAFTGTAVEGTQLFCDLWIFGVMGALLGTFLSTMGLGLQKLTHEKLKAEGKEIENYCNHPLWLAGIGCLVIDAVLDVWTFGLAVRFLFTNSVCMFLF